MRTRIDLGLCILALIACGCDSGAGNRPPYMIDSDNRIVIHHGVNVANTAKHSEGHLPWQTQQDFAQLPEWGFNLVRYLVFWEAIEPTQGQYDDAYIANTIERIGWLKDLGVDVLLDVHQDLYGPRFTGNGFPDWTVNDDGLAFTERQPWNLNYLEPAVIAAFKNFWRSDDMKAQYVAMLEHLLAQVDAQPNVVGLDIMNEPFPGQDPDFEAVALTRLYEDVQAMRRRNGFKTRLFFEPVIFTSAGLPSQLRFQPDPDCVYSPHYYDVFCHEGGDYADLNAWWMRQAVDGKVAEARAYGTPACYGEFGISTQVMGWQRYLDDFIGLMNTYHLSWIYYSFDKINQEGFGIVDENGAANERLAHLVEVYPQRIAGRNPEIQYGPRSFQLQYDPIDTAAPTVVFVPGSLGGVRATANGSTVAPDAASHCILHYNAGATERQIMRVEWE
ncbi:MAG TPA: cellulase family glycosylhydrolase [Phycisphaerae bacterium]|nr:cellulase family glycosylhydrolase [Phycisphaerae bacterium]